MMDGVGIDLMEVSRFSRLLEQKPSLLKKLFTDYEWNYATQKHTAHSLAGFWCAKEAVVKAISRYHPQVQITDVCLAHHPYGAPYVLEIKNSEINPSHLSISISHTKNMATAICHFSGQRA